MLNDIKILLGIAADDTTQDEKLNLLISTATDRLRNLLGGIDPPDCLTHIIREVAIIRFNRIGSEGMSSHTVEGESVSFADDDFSAFSDEIQAYQETQTGIARGKMRFL